MGSGPEHLRAGGADASWHRRVAAYAGRVRDCQTCGKWAFFWIAVEAAALITALVALGYGLSTYYVL